MLSHNFIYLFINYQSFEFWGLDVVPHYFFFQMEVKFLLELRNFILHPTPQISLNLD